MRSEAVTTTETLSFFQILRLPGLPCFAWRFYFEGRWFETLL
jgi:hypothetical protein